MGSPLYTAETQAGTGLVAAYIQYIGEREPNNIRAISEGSADNPFQASLVIGASCLLLIHGIDREANFALGQVRDNMRTYVADKGRYSKLGPVATQLGLIAGMILERDDSDTARQFQLDSHAEDVKDLKVVRPLFRSRDCDAIGQMTEQALTSVATRYAGPGTLTVRSLLHHDMGVKPCDNSDFLVINSGASGLEPTAQRGQAKSKCLEFCKDEPESRNVRRTRAEYMNDIVLVSGHCDVINPERGHSLNGLAKRLIREAQGEAGSEQVEILDEATLHLLQVITDPEDWRMGTRRMERSAQFKYKDWSRVAA